MKIHRHRFPQNTIGCTGYLFDSNRLKLDEIIRRILSLWVSGSLLYKDQKCYIMLLPQVMPVNVTKAKGQVLMRYGAYVSNIVLTEDELKEIIQPAGSILHLYQGELRIIELDQCEWIDPVQWIDLSEYQFRKVTPLGPPPVVAKIIKAVPERATRKVFSDEKYQASEEQQAMLKALEDKKTKQNTSMSWLHRFINLFGRTQQTGGSVGQSATTYDELKQPAKRMGLAQRIASMIMLSQVGRMLGRKQGKYIKKMMDMFEQGDIEQALKHAIPLADVQSSLQAKAPSLFTPTSRDNLQIHARHGDSGYSYNLSDDFLEQMRTLYERAFQTLDRAGKYAEAAFVLAELLKDVNRAIDYLEKHDQKQLAAELAEGRQVEPARIIRQWIVAGNFERAMFIANYTGCFIPAISLLEKNHHTLAAQLRKVYAEQMAAAGDYEKAVEVAWPVTSLRNQVIEWLDYAIADEGDVGARMLVKKITLEPESIVQYRSRLKVLFESHGDQYVLERQTATQALLNMNPARSSSTLASMALKAYIQDCAEGLVSHHKTNYKRLIDISGDIALKTDVKSLNISTSLKRSGDRLIDRKTPWEIDIRGVGQHTIYDVSLISRNRLLVALGEIGVQIRSFSGKVLQTFKAPCHQIVISDSLNRALLIAYRDRNYSLHCLDLNNHKITPWIELPSGRFANTYDGLTWFMSSSQGELTGFDTQADGAISSWHVSDLPGEVMLVNRNSDNLQVLLMNAPGDYEMWRYELPSMSLRERTAIQQEHLKNYDYATMRVDGVMLGIRINDTGDSETITLSTIKNSSSVNKIPLDITGELESIKFDMDWIIVSSVDDSVDNTYRLYFIDCDASVPRVVRLIISGQHPLSFRTFGQMCIVYDSTGRLLYVDLEKGVLIADNYT